jgi:hypothetical protein
LLGALRQLSCLTLFLGIDDFCLGVLCAKLMAVMFWYCLLPLVCSLSLCLCPSLLSNTFWGAPFSAYLSMITHNGLTITHMGFLYRYIHMYVKATTTTTPHFWILRIKLKYTHALMRVSALSTVAPHTFDLHLTVPLLSFFFRMAFIAQVERLPLSPFQHTYVAVQATRNCLTIH